LREFTASVADVVLPAIPNPAQVWGPEGYAYHQKWISETPGRYQPATRRAILAAADANALAYTQARREVDLARREIRSVFSTADLLVTPRMPATPGKIEDALAGAPPPGTTAGGVNARNTSPFDVFGVPAISVPCGFTSAGLPIGLEIIDPPFGELAVRAWRTVTSRRQSGIYGIHSLTRKERQACKYGFGNETEGCRVRRKLGFVTVG
jgi:aspartyl-tRNA(Asn)/glutamyl-tRNA(Gln) amidotransferase subunit A